MTAAVATAAPVVLAAKSKPPPRRPSPTQDATAGGETSKALLAANESCDNGEDDQTPVTVIPLPSTFSLVTDPIPPGSLDIVMSVDHGVMENFEDDIAPMPFPI